MKYLLVLVFVLTCTGSLYAADEVAIGQAGDARQDTTTVYDDDMDITEDADAKLFADFEKILEEDIETLFDGITTEEDVQEAEVQPTKIAQEVISTSLTGSDVLKEAELPSPETK